MSARNNGGRAGSAGNVAPNQARSHITQAMVKKLIDYDAASGNLVWKFNVGGRAKAGAIVGYVRKDGYRVLMLRQKVCVAHRVVWLWVKGQWPSQDLDHVNGNKLDNRIENLREVSHKENMQNLHGAYKGAVSKYLGVSPVGERWMASITIDGKTKSLGRFDTEEQAFAAYVAEKRQVHPFAEIAKCTT